MTKPIDSHCHIYREEFSEDREEVIEDAKRELDCLMVPGTTYKTSRKAVDLSKEHPDFVVPAVGVHPGRPEDFNKLNQIRDILAEEKVAAIGEIGLDFQVATSKDERKAQEKAFKEQIKIAKNHEIPVVIHSRNAEKRVIEILEEKNLNKVFMHCFNGSKDLLELAVDNNFLVGVTTQILYSERAQQVGKNVPLHKLLIETDSPFLYPDGRNNPSNVAKVAEKLSELRKEKTEEIISDTNSNFRNLFNHAN